MKRILILILFVWMQGVSFGQANWLRLTKQEIKDKGAIENEGVVTLESEGLFTYVFNFDSSDKCNKVIFVIGSLQMLEIYTDIINDNYTRVNGYSWIGLERTFTVKVTYFKDSGELGKYGAFVFVEE